MTDGYRDIIKGEALGLRSFVYFDLLRMYGPIYKDNASSPSIPYRTQFNRDVAKLLPATEVIDSIIDCLHEAETLLENDPMNISFPSYSEDTSIDPLPELPLQPHEQVCREGRAGSCLSVEG